MFELIESTKQHVSLKEYLDLSGSTFLIKSALIIIVVICITKLCMNLFKASEQAKRIANFFSGLWFVAAGIILVGPITLTLFYFSEHKDTYYNATYEAKDAEIKNVMLWEHTGFLAGIHSYKIDVKDVDSQSVTTIVLSRNPKVYIGDKGTLIVKIETDTKPKKTTDLDNVRVESIKFK